MSTPARVAAVLCIAVGAYLAGMALTGPPLQSALRNPAGGFCTTLARCTPSTTPPVPATARVAVCGWSRSMPAARRSRGPGVPPAPRRG